MAAQRTNHRPVLAPLPPAWVRPRPAQVQPILAGPRSHRRPGQLRRDLVQLLGPVLAPVLALLRRFGRDWGGAAVDAARRVFHAAGAFIAGLSVLAVTAAMVLLVTGAGR